MLWHSISPYLSLLHSLLIKSLLQRYIIFSHCFYLHLNILHCFYHWHVSSVYIRDSVEQLLIWSPLFSVMGQLKKNITKALPFASWDILIVATNALLLILLLKFYFSWGINGACWNYCATKPMIFLYRWVEIKWNDPVQFNHFIPKFKWWL